MRHLYSRDGCGNFRHFSPESYRNNFVAHFGRYHDSRQLSDCIMTRADNNKRGAHRFLRRCRIVDISMQPQFILDVVVK